MSAYLSKLCLLNFYKVFLSFYLIRFYLLSIFIELLLVEQISAIKRTHLSSICLVSGWSLWIIDLCSVPNYCYSSFFSYSFVFSSSISNPYLNFFTTIYNLVQLILLLLKIFYRFWELSFSSDIFD